MLHQQGKNAHPARVLTSDFSFTADTQVNTYTSGDQVYAAVAPLQGGGFVITWQSQNQDGSGAGVYAQIFDANQKPSGSEFIVNTITADDESQPDICALKSGKFVITYQTKGGDGDDWGVQMRVFNADGSDFLTTTTVNVQTSADQSQPAITCLQNGGFAVTWHSRYQDGSGFGIYARFFNADGTAKTTEFAVNTVTSGDQMYPSIASSPDSSIIVAWQDASSGNLDVRARAFSADGTAKTVADFVVNTYTSNDQNSMNLATFPDNGYIIVWQSAGQAGQTSGIYFQRYKADGSLYGTETQANTYTNDGQYSPTVTTLSSTSFVIAWESSNQDGSNRGVFAQRFNQQDSSKKGTEFQVNTYTSDNQGWVYARPYQSNSYIFTWHSNGQDGSSYGVFGTIFMDCDAGKSQYEQSCVASCPAQYYTGSKNFRCLACDSSCSTCSSTATTCTACSNGKYLASSTCQSCDSSCLTCSTSATTCVTCSAGRYISSSTCPSCDGTCATCSGAATTCTSCTGSRYLLASTSACVTDCGTGFYPDSSSHTCKACDATCSTCSTTAAHCTACTGSRYLLASTSACVTDCGSGFYSKSATHTCEACDGSCATCTTTATTCTGCADGKFVSGSACQSCSVSCATCSGDANTCTSCSGSTYLLNSKCVTDCGDGYVANGNTHRCEVPPKPSPAKSKTVPIVVGTVVGSFFVVGLGALAKSYFSLRAKRRSNAVQRIQVKPNSVVPTENMNFADGPGVVSP